MIDDLGFDTEDVRVQTEGWVQTMKELQAVVIAAEADYGTPLKDLIIIFLTVFRHAKKLKLSDLHKLTECEKGNFFTRMVHTRIFEILGLEGIFG